MGDNIGLIGSNMKAFVVGGKTTPQRIMDNADGDVAAQLQKAATKENSTKIFSPNHQVTIKIGQTFKAPFIIDKDNPFANSDQPRDHRLSVDDPFNMGTTYSTELTWTDKNTPGNREGYLDADELASADMTVSIDQKTIEAGKKHHGAAALTKTGSTYGLKVAYLADRANGTGDQYSADSPDGPQQKHIDNLALKIGNFDNIPEDRSALPKPTTSSPRKSK